MQEKPPIEEKNIPSKMSNQCSCGRDLNNNYLNYPSAYGNSSSSFDRDSNTGGGGGSNKMSGGSSNPFASKLMAVGGSSKNMRSKEQTRSDRRN